jgi:hypothetical protein
VDIFLVSATVFAAVVGVWNAWRVGGDDPLWDLRWRALGADDRARLAAAALPGGKASSLEDPEERQLAEGFGRRERRRRAYLDLAVLVVLGFSSALLLAGIVGPGLFGLVLGVYAVLRGSAESLRDRRIKSRVTRAAAQDPAPSP